MLWKQQEEEVEEEEDCPIRKEGVVIKTRKLRHNFTAFDIAMIPRKTQLQTLSRRLHEEKDISQTDVMMKRNSTRIILILVTAQPVKSPFSATSHSRLHVFLLLLTSQREKENLEIADNCLSFNTAKLACSISDSESKCSRSF
jgi:hypothetical protein